MGLRPNCSECNCAVVSARAVHAPKAAPSRARNRDWGGWCRQRGPDNFALLMHSDRAIRAVHPPPTRIRFAPYCARWQVPSFMQKVPG